MKTKRKKNLRFKCHTYKVIKIPECYMCYTNNKSVSYKIDGKQVRLLDSEMPTFCQTGSTRLKRTNGLKH